MLFLSTALSQRHFSCLPDAVPPLALILHRNAALTDAVPFLAELLYTLESLHRHRCYSALNTKLLIFHLPSSPVKRSREEREAGGSGTEPQKKKQKEEKKTEQDGSSPSAHHHRLQTTQTQMDYLSG